MREIDNRFIDDLLGGKLVFFFDRVKNNRDVLSLEVRDGYINIYYRGGSLLRIEQKKRYGKYAMKFDAKYCKNKKNCDNYRLLADLDRDDVEAFEKHFDLMMREMDSWFLEHPKAERDYQHDLLLGNPEIIDIEYQIRTEMRLDMLYFSGDTLYIIENKFGNGAIGGKSGLSEHYRDMCRLLDDETVREEMLQSVCRISQAKRARGLTDRIIERDKIKNVEILFLLADYIPKGKALANELAKMNGSVSAKLLTIDSSRVGIDIGKARDISLLGGAG